MSLYTKCFVLLVIAQIFPTSYQTTITRSSDGDKSESLVCTGKTVLIKNDDTQSFECIGTMLEGGCDLTLTGQVDANKIAYIPESTNTSKLTIKLPEQPYTRSNEKCVSHQVGTLSVQVHTSNLNRSVWNDDIGENAIKPTMDFHINQTDQTLSVTFKEHWAGILMKIFIECIDGDGNNYLSGDANRCVMVKYGGTVNYPLTGSRFFPSPDNVTTTTTPSQQTSSQATTENNSNEPNTHDPLISSSVTTTPAASTTGSSSTRDPSHSNSTTITPAPISQDDSSGFPIVPGIAGALLFLLLVLLIVVLIIYKKRKSSKEKLIALTNMNSPNNDYDAVQFPDNHTSTTVLNVNAGEAPEDFIGYKTEPDLYDAPIAHEEPTMSRPFDEYAVVDKSKKTDSPVRSSAYIFMGPDHKKPDDSLNNVGSENDAPVKEFKPIEMVIPVELLDPMPPENESGPYTEL